eukprot:jgi/Chrpa1/18582/Chrysochromulina_OHIO_Genome00025611-RA
MPKRSLEAAPSQHAAVTDSGQRDQTGATPPPVHGRSAFVACTTNLDATNGQRVNDRPDTLPERRPGWAMAFALGPLELSDTPVEYLEALRRLRAMRQVHEKYVRPTVRSAGGTANATAYGIFSKVPPEERLVAEERDCWAHARAARELLFPERLPGTELGPAILRAIDRIVDLGPELERTRRALTAEWRAISESLRPLSKALVGAGPTYAKGIMRDANLLMVAACIEVLEWPDVWLAHDLHFGMHAAGNRSESEPGMRDTGVFRAHWRPAAYSLADLYAGSARPLLPRLIEYGGHHMWLREPGPALMSSAAWFTHLLHLCKTRAGKALDKAGVSAAEMAAAATQANDRNHPSDALWRGICERCPAEQLDGLNKMWLAESMSYREVRAGTMLAPMTPRQFTAWADAQCGGVRRTRPAPRYVIEQGLKEDGSKRLRCIDDDRVSGVNDATGEVESPDLISPAWVVMIVVAIAARCAAAGVVMTRCIVALDDMKHAFRTMPQCVQEVSHVAYYSFARGTAVFQQIPGHCFGKRASPLNFSRLPRLICHAAASFLLVLAAHYVDDFPSVDVKAGGPMSSQEALQAVFQAFGWNIELGKRKIGKLANIVLGVLVCLARILTDGVAVISPVRAKIDSVLSDLQKCKARGKLSSGEASSFWGRLGWLSSSTYGRIGRAATQCLMQRSHEDANDWNSQLDAMLEFLSAVLAEGVLPPLEFSLSPGRKTPVIVYTDASFHWLQEPGKERVPVAILGFYVIDRVTGAEFISGMMVPPFFFKFLSTDLETYISQMELVAAIAVYYTLPALLADRAVIHFIDNFAALSALVHGYASKPDLARLVNLFHAQMAALHCWFYGDWVPSKANPADVPTRAERAHEMPPSASWIDMVLPALEAVERNVGAWIQQVRAHVRQSRAAQQRD